MRTKGSLPVITTAAGVLLGLCLPVAAALYGTHDQPLEGQRYGSLCSLARQLEASARGVLEAAKLDGAADDAENRASSSARALPSIRSFAESATDLRGRLDSYPMLPFEVPARVDDLMVRAQAVSDGIRSAHTLESTYADWEAALGILGRMRLLLSGSEVEAPSAHAIGALSGARLQEFRQLAHDVDVSAREAHERARREVGDYPDRGQQYLGELQHFAAQSRDLRRLADLAVVDPQEIGPVVDRVLEDARQADREMRDAHVFASVWVGSGSTITMLQRMARLVQS